MTAYSISSENTPDSASKSALLSWPDWALAFLVGGVGLFIYGRTLTPGLLAGDGGEFQTLAYLWGHSHPTGYPVYLTMARLFAFLPTGELAYRVNLFSAVMAAVAVAGVYVNGRLLTRYRLIPFIGALAIAVSATFWSQALIAEVYTAGAAFIVWIIVALLWWRATGSQRALFVAGLLGGLSLGVHMSVVLLAPAVLVYLLLPKGKIKDWKSEIKSLIFNLKSPILGALTGLVITIVLFLLMNWNNPTASYFTSVTNPSRSAWGLSANQIDGAFERLFWGWQAKQFQTFMWDTHVFAQQAADYWENLPSQLPLLLIILAFVGVVVLMVKQWKTAVFFLAALAIQLLYFFNYAIWDLYVFFIPSYLLLTLLAIAGMGGIVDGGVARLGKNGSDQTKRMGQYVIEIALAVLVLFVVWLNFQPQVESVAVGENPFEFDEYPVYDEFVGAMATAVTLELPENAILFTDWDMLYPYYFAATLQQGRDDLMFIETYPADDQDGVADSVVDFVSENMASHPIYFSDNPYELIDAGFSTSPVRIGSLRAFKIQE